MFVKYFYTIGCTYWLSSQISVCNRFQHNDITKFFTTWADALFALDVCVCVCFNVTIKLTLHREWVQTHSVHLCLCHHWCNFKLWQWCWCKCKRRRQVWTHLVKQSPLNQALGEKHVYQGETETLKSLGQSDRISYKKGRTCNVSFT